MKTKKPNLSKLKLKKFEIARINNLNSIIGGSDNNCNGTGEDWTPPVSKHCD